MVVWFLMHQLFESAHPRPGIVLASDVPLRPIESSRYLSRKGPELGSHFLNKTESVLRVGGVAVGSNSSCIVSLLAPIPLQSTNAPTHHENRYSTADTIVKRPLHQVRDTVWKVLLA